MNDHAPESSSSLPPLETATPAAPPSSGRGARLGALGGVVVLAAVGGIVYAKTRTPAPAAPTVAAATYKDGTYRATGLYRSPGGPEEIQATVTVKDGIIVDSTFEGTSASAKSKNYMGIFAENYKPFVIGKNLKDLRLDKVSGSSLTPKGFNDALEKIRQEAAG